VRIVFLFFLIGHLMMAQSLETPPNTLSLNGFRFESFDETILYTDFSADYFLGNGWGIGIEGFYNKSGIFERFRLPIHIKKYISNNVFLKGGVQTEWNFFPEDGIPWNVMEKGRRTEVFMGMGYEPKRNMLIEAGYRQLLGKSKFAPLGFENVNQKSVFTLGSKIKF